MKYLLILFLSTAGCSFASAETTSATVTPTSIRYSKDILLAKEFFGHRQIDRLNLSKWINKTGINLGTSYSLETNLVPEGLTLQFTVEGTPYLVGEFYRYVLASIALMVNLEGDRLEGARLADFKKFWLNLRQQIENDIQALVSKSDAGIANPCELQLMPRIL